MSAQFSIAEEGIFINAPASMIVPGNYYLLALLNSKVADFYMRSLGVTRNGGYFEYKPMFVEQFPAPPISARDQEPFSILASKPNLENQMKLESLICSLYDLSTDEIAFIKKIVQ